MIFADFYNLLEKIRKNLKNETETFKKELYNMSKENIMLEYVELFIYSRLKIFFQYVGDEARNDNYLFSIEELEKISQVDNFLSIIKENYYKGGLYEDKLTNRDLQNYLKSI